MRARSKAALASVLVGWAAATIACHADPAPRALDTVLVDLTLYGVEPDLALPDTVLAVHGDSFVDAPWGVSQLVLEGTVEGQQAVSTVRIPASYVHAQRLDAVLDHDVFAALGGDGARLEGFGVVEVTSAVDGRLYRSAPVDVALTLRETLEPNFELVSPDGIVFPNDPIELWGEGLLLAGEGESVAVVEGCFRAAGADACAPVAPREIPITPAAEHDRTRGTFLFSPAIAGIEPGRFEGTVRVVNRHASGAAPATDPLPCAWDLEAPIVYGSDTTEASLGRYVTLTGAGFVGGEGSTTLHFRGEFTSDSGEVVVFDDLLVPEFVDGHTLRYVVNEEDAIGRVLDVRYDPGTFEGTLTPVTAWGPSEIVGDPVPTSFRLAPVKQVVYIDFLPGYTESLRHFGLRAVDHLIRERVMAVVRRDFETINLEVRSTLPTDFAHYTRVDVSGPDPNGLGLLGYDNSPGKDTDNRRLYDRIGGVNALTQEDGYPGYGGIFIESLFGFSTHPNGLADVVAPDPRFDALFDPFRPDVGGTPVTSADLGEEIPVLTSGNACPHAGERRLQIACAVWALGSMIGSTISHEIGHALGLADPYGPYWHNTGDAPDRLMDADRPFDERSEIQGAGPSRFCVDEYAYLRLILPSASPPDTTPRPPC